jgi:hypothetical protein
MRPAMPRVQAHTTRDDSHVLCQGIDDRGQNQLKVLCGSCGVLAIAAVQAMFLYEQARCLLC